MNERNDEKVQGILKVAIGPVADRELKSDLWPQMLRRLDERPGQVPWFDWILVALLTMCLCFFPEAIPVLLYHL